MAVTAALVEATGERLRYLLTQDGAAGTTLTIANATLLADILTAAGAGVSGLPLKPIIDAGRNGIGPVAAGALNQAGARAICLSDDAANVMLTNNNVPRAVVETLPRSASVAVAVDANVDGSANPVLEVTMGAAAQTAYLDFHLRHTVDL